MKFSKLFLLLYLFLTLATVSFSEQAGFLEKQYVLNVSGDPISWELIKESIYSLLRRKVRLLPGSELTVFEDKITPAYNLYSGQELQISIPYKIEGDDYDIVEEEVIIRVINNDIALKTPQLLFISNNPENVSSPGILFNGALKKDDIVRMMFYHQAINWEYDLASILINNGNQIAKIFVIKGIGGSDYDSIFTGHIATKRFLESKIKKEGIVLEIAPGEIVELSNQKLKTMQTASGIFYLFAISGTIDVKVLAYDKNLGSESAFLRHQRVENKYRGGIFDITKIDFCLNFGVEDSIRYFRLGENPKIYDLVSGDLLRGNYTLSHVYHVIIDNQENDKDRKIDIELMGRGGMVRGNILIDNELYETGLLRKRGDSFLLKNIDIYPNEVKKITIETMPQPGSYYPIHIILREVN